MSDAMLLACVFWYLNAYRISRRSLFCGETALLVMKAWTFCIKPRQHSGILFQVVIPLYPPQLLPQGPVPPRPTLRAYPYPQAG